MSYVRPAKVEEVKKWLLDTGLISDETQAQQLAEALVEKYELIGYFKTL